MAFSLVVVVFAALLGTQVAISAQGIENSHHGPGMCKALGGEVGGGSTRRVIDITHSYRADLPKWQSKTGLGVLTSLVSSLAEGDFANVSELKFEEVHSGTHVDAPGHYVQEHYVAGLDVASLDLDTLIGKLIHLVIACRSQIGHNNEGIRSSRRQECHLLVLERIENVECAVAARQVAELVGLRYKTLDSNPNA